MSVGATPVIKPGILRDLSGSERFSEDVFRKATEMSGKIFESGDQLYKYQNASVESDRTPSPSDDEEEDINKYFFPYAPVAFGDRFNTDSYSLLHEEPPSNSFSSSPVPMIIENSSPVPPELKTTPALKPELQTTRPSQGQRLMTDQQRSDLMLYTGGCTVQ